MSQRIAVVAGIVLLLCAGIGVTSSQTQQPYVIGYISDFSGPFVDTFSPVHAGFRAHIDRVNAAGGVNGRQIQTIVRDDQLNATRAASLMRELVTSEAVNSVWSLSLSSTLPGVYTLAKRLSVPAISSVSAIKSTLPPAEEYAYSTGSPFEVAGEVSAKLAAPVAPSKGKLMCVTIDSAGGFAACGHTAAAAGAVGFTNDSLMFPPAKVEYGAIGERIASSQPAIVVTHLPAGLAPGVLLAARSAGYRGPMLLHNVAFNEATLVKAMETAGNFENTYVFSRYVLAHDPLPEVAEIERAAEAVGVKPADFSGNHIAGWVHGKVAVAALTKCGVPCNGEKLNAALSNLSVDVGGLSGGPVVFQADDHQGTSWWKTYSFDSASKKFRPTGDWVEAPSKLTYTVGDKK
ncbi:MAG TPA: ABC transporter substrate-binding protein [Steroidobacteraceae bacterium]|jgi:ABC-type branched-subunit amino acid transport system substrate-binding protein|nr:ABC transporter substrate-binding protein [Steroidobacteraceae bacterium]